MLSLHALACARSREERGQAALMMLGVAAAVLVSGVALLALGNALGAKGRHQRAADLAATWRSTSIARPPLRRRSAAGAGTGWRFVPRTCPFQKLGLRRLA